MGRIYAEIKVDGRRCLALFDSGARNTFAVPSVAGLGTRVRLKKPMAVAIGGRRQTPREQCTLEGTLQGKRVILNGFVLPSIGCGDRDRPIEILVGALAMQQWGIALDLQNERLDLTHYPREFVEF